jgi:PAS domain S-box-containing protein
MLSRPSSIVQWLGDWWSQRTLALRFATLTAVLIAATALIQGTALVGFASRIVNTLERERVQERLGEAARQLKTHVKELRSIPLILSGTPPVPRIAALSTGGEPEPGESLEVWIERLSIIFRSFVEANPDIMQARFIGAADGGRELVRINSVAGKPEVVDATDLQRKGDRAYFREASKLRAGEVYLSSIEANQENGVVVRPFQPTLRAATPIFTEEGEFFGAIVVNMAVDHWLQNISALSKVSGNFMVVDQGGDYIYRSDNGPLFNSLQRESASFKQNWPQLVSVFNRSGPAYTSVREGDTFVSAERVAYDPENTSQFIVLAADISADSVFGETWRLTTLGVVIALVLAMIGVLAAYLVSRPLKGLMSAARQIAEGKLDVSTLARKGKNVEIGELGQALRIMEEAVESRDASLRKSGAALQAIVDNTIDGLITIDRHGNIVRYNRGCEDIFGYTAGDAVGQNVSLLLPRPDGDEPVDSAGRDRDIVATPFVEGRREVTAQHRDGRLIDIEVAITEIKIGDEELSSGIVRDITKQKQVERMKSEFISTVTHELRTPLTSIMGTLELAGAGVLGELPDELRHMIDLAHDNGERLVNIINDILDIDKMEAGQLEFARQSENLKGLLERAMEQNAAYAQRHDVAICMDDVPANVVIETDPDRFQQVMSNLVSNAAKFSPEGEKVRIAAKMSGGTVRISVADKGPGIPLAFRKRIFEKFAQADSSDTRQKGGTGLGLAIAKTIVERLGGEIGFDTEVGAGTTFYFDLPASESRPDEEESERQSVAAEDDRQILRAVPKGVAAGVLPRVLHVENDADTTAVLAAIVADAAEVTAVGTAEEACEILSKQSFDLLILDYYLPGKDGDSVLHYLSKRHEPAPHVLVYSVGEDFPGEWPLVTRTLVKSRTGVATLRENILELLAREPRDWALQRGA